MPTAALTRWESRHPKRDVGAALTIAALLVAIALFDEATGAFHITVLYAIPIMVAAWAFGLLGGLVTGAIAVGITAVTHSLLLSPELAVDVTTDAIVFVFAAFLVDRLRGQLRTIRALEAKRDFDLGLARDIQTRMLTPAPDDERFEIACALHFATDVGGDYYRLAEVEGKLFLFVGDISGKGMSAALFAVLVDETIADALSATHGLEALVDSVNRRMYARMPPEMFVTMLFAVMDGDRLAFVNAGHVRPLLFLAASRRASELPEAGTLPLGVEPSIGGDPAVFEISPGDMLLVCSDGVTESPALIDAPERLLSTFEETAAQGPQAVVDRVAALAESRGQTDDVTAICVRRR